MSFDSAFRIPHSEFCLSRRHVLGSGALGLGGFGLAHLLGRDGLLAADGPAKPPLEKPVYDTRPKSPHHPPKATGMISLFMGGGPSHIDLFDPKPKLTALDGKLYAADVKFDNEGGASKVLMASPFAFAKRGRCGMELSDLIPHTAGIADDICIIRSMHLGGIRNHGGGMRAMDTGRGVAGRAALGAWLTYGLGSETRNLPAFVALVVRKEPPGSPFWAAGPLPSVYQGTLVREERPRIMNLDPPPHMRGESQDAQLAFLGEVNRRHLAGHPGETDLQARIASYELAARMQLAATEALDVNRESKETHALYGLNDEATRPLAEAGIIARRLVERGVRFVQVWDYSWDMHENINERLPEKSRSADRPCAALVADLKRRGMLDRTLVFWGGEMGRLPVVQRRDRAGFKGGRAGPQH